LARRAHALRFLILGALVPIVFIAAGIELTRTRTLIAVVCMSVGATLILAFSFHLGVGALVAVGLLAAMGVFYSFRGYSRIR
jgi:hypothetical protein